MANLGLQDDILIHLHVLVDDCPSLMDIGLGFETSHSHIEADSYSVLGRLYDASLDISITNRTDIHNCNYLGIRRKVRSDMNRQLYLHALGLLLLAGEALLKAGEVSGTVVVLKMSLEYYASTSFCKKSFLLLNKV